MCAGVVLLHALNKEDAAKCVLPRLLVDLDRVVARWAFQGNDEFFGTCQETLEVDGIPTVYQAVDSVNNFSTTLTYITQRTQSSFLHAV